jgi:hypothetical protein
MFYLCDFSPSPSRFQHVLLLPNPSRMQAPSLTHSNLHFEHSPLTSLCLEQMDVLPLASSS